MITDSSEGEPADPVEPPRTSHLDGIKTVIIDAGHGGSDIGAHSEDMSLDEKHINLSVAQYLQDYLEDAGYTVIMVRDTLEEGSSLSLRGQVMEQYASSADLFFSIHHNAANTTARGAEVLAQIADKDGGADQDPGEALLEEYEELGCADPFGCIQRRQQWGLLLYKPCSSSAVHSRGNKRILFYRQCGGSEIH